MQDGNGRFRPRGEASEMLVCHLPVAHCLTGTGKPPTNLYSLIFLPVKVRCRVHTVKGDLRGGGERRAALHAFPSWT
jgi:hypothetical protein